MSAYETDNVTSFDDHDVVKFGGGWIEVSQLVIREAH